MSRSGGLTITRPGHHLPRLLGVLTLVTGLPCAIGPAGAAESALGAETPAEPTGADTIPATGANPGTDGESRAPSTQEVQVLLDQVAWCLATDCDDDLAPLLGAAAESLRAQPAGEGRIVDWLTIAQLQLRLGNTAAARSALGEARTELKALTGRPSQPQLQQRLVLGYRALGDEEAIRSLEAEALASAGGDGDTASYPFTEGPGRLKAGLGVSGASFDETTLRANANISFFKPWPRQDVSANGLFILDYDSGRDVNRTRPNLTSLIVYRYHLDGKWSLFLNNLSSVNSGVFASSTDDEDTSVLSSSYAGLGLNLWRGKSTDQFLDLQFGVGARYAYDEIDFKVERNELSPAVALILFGRGIKVGAATLSPSVAVGLGSDRLDEFVIYSDVNLSLPISKRWAWDSRIVARYTTDPVTNQVPNLNFQYITGFTYTFQP